MRLLQVAALAATAHAFVPLQRLARPVQTSKPWARWASDGDGEEPAVVAPEAEDAGPEPGEEGYEAPKIAVAPAPAGEVVQPEQLPPTVHDSHTWSSLRRSAGMLRAAPVASAEAANAWVRATSDARARHNCFAWRLSDGATRTNGDGEPGGTAGPPYHAESLLLAARRARSPAPGPGSQRPQQRPAGR